MSLVIVCKNDGRQVECNEKCPLELGTKMLGYPKLCHNLCAYGATAKKQGCPKKCPRWLVDRMSTKRWDIPIDVIISVPMEVGEK